MSGFGRVALGEVTKLEAGVGFPLSLQGRPFGDYPLAKVGDISRAGRSGQSVLSVADHFVDKADLPRLRARPVPAGSVLFAKIGEAIRQNHRVIAGCDLLIDNNAMAAIPTAKIESRYLYHFLKTVDFYALTTSTTVPSLRKSKLHEITLPLPPLSEQRRIAAILDKADALRVNHREVAEKFDQLLQSVFIEMFGDPASNPKRWQKSVLGELASIQTGSTPPTSSPGFFEGPIPFVTPGDLRNLVRNSRRTLSMEGALKSRTVPAGSTLVCCIGATIGKMGLAMRECAFNQQINAVTWHYGVDSIYGYCLLYFLSGEIARRGSSTTLPIINKSDFEKIEVIVPPIDLQKVFSEIAISIQKQSEVVSRADAKCQEIFRSIQNEFFAVRDDCAR